METLNLQSDVSNIVPQNTLKRKQNLGSCYVLTTSTGTACDLDRLHLDNGRSVGDCWGLFLQWEILASFECTCACWDAISDSTFKKTHPLQSVSGLLPYQTPKERMMSTYRFESSISFFTISSSSLTFLSSICKFMTLKCGLLSCNTNRNDALSAIESLKKWERTGKALNNRFVLKSWFK